jgi:transposase
MYADELPFELRRSILQEHLVGLAPIARDSGTMKGHRMVFGGRASVRGALYMAAVVGARHNLVIRDFYSRLRDRGRPPKLALIACAHTP